MNAMILRRGGTRRGTGPAPLVLAALLLPGMAASGKEPAAVAARAAVVRSLPFIAEEGEEWIKERKCASCHHTSFLTWSHQLAADAGFDVDREKLAEWTGWALRKQLSEHEKGGPVGERNIEGLSQFILGRDHKSAAKDHDDALRQFPRLIVSKQEKDGAWMPGGQLPTQKRPKAETTAVSTMWALLALEESGAGGPEAAAARKRARDFLAGSKLKGTSTEWFVMRLLLELDSGDKAAIADRRDALLALQNDNGGWSWVQGDPSDALATGQALHGLAEAGLDHRRPSVRKAWRFLVTTQEPDGAWLVKSTKGSKKEEDLFTSVFWGTSWATIGILRTLPPAD